MTSKESRKLGYELIAASAFEVGLVKNDKGIRTWFAQDFNGVWPSLEHPKIQQAIDINERSQHDSERS